MPGGELRSTGLYRYVRHPIYTGVMALAVGSAIPSGSLAIATTTLALVAWLVLKARWEERRLEIRYPAYAAYAARTPRFIPRETAFVLTERASSRRKSRFDYKDCLLMSACPASAHSADGPLSLWIEQK